MAPFRKFVVVFLEVAVVAVMVLAVAIVMIGVVIVVGASATYTNKGRQAGLYFHDFVGRVFILRACIPMRNKIIYDHSRLQIDFASVRPSPSTMPATTLEEHQRTVYIARRPKLRIKYSYALCYAFVGARCYASPSFAINISDARIATCQPINRQT